MDQGTWWAAVHGVTKSRTWLSDFTFTFHFHALEKEMTTHSSVLAWRIPGMGEPGGLPSMGSQSRTRLKWLSNSRFIIPFLWRSRHLLISWLQSPSTVILEPKKIKSVTVYTFSPCICHEVMKLDAMILVFLILSFKPAFLLFSFTLFTGFLV